MATEPWAQPVPASSGNQQWRRQQEAEGKQEPLRWGGVHMPIDCGPNKRVPRQDGRVQGPELTSFHKNTKFTTNCWTTIDIIIIKKKDILLSKAKKPRDYRRCTHDINKFQTHKLENNYISEVLPQENPEPQVKLPSLWVWHQEKPPEHLALKGFDHRNLTGWRETETPLLEGTHNFQAHWEGPRGKSSDFKRAWPNLPAGLRGSSGDIGGGCGSLQGQKHLWWTYWGALIGTSGPRGRRFEAKTWSQPIAQRLQCSDVSGQTTNNARTQLHPSGDRLPKVFLNPQLPLNTHLDTVLSTKRTKPSSIHQWASIRPSQHEAYTSLLDQPHPPGGRH